MPDRNVADVLQMGCHNVVIVPLRSAWMPQGTRVRWSIFDGLRGAQTQSCVYRSGLYRLRLFLDGLYFWSPVR
jgi:hypothetical protein